MKLSDTEYWAGIMQRRMSKRDEVTRLLTVLRGFYLDQGPTHVGYDFTLLNYGLCADRPYGSKNVAASIAFNLGWDYERRLCTSPMPSEVENAAMELHEAVIERLSQDREMYFNQA